MHSCGNCGKVFRDNYNLMTHVSRLRPCSGTKIPQFQHNNLSMNPNQSLENPNNTLRDENQSFPDENQSSPDENRSSPDENRSSPDENRSSPDENQSSPDENQSFENNPRTCQYCLHTYSSVKYLKEHDKKCKYKEDPIRALELEQDIIPELPVSNTECRFCNKVYHNSSNLNRHIITCKEREQYKQILLKEKETRNIGVVNNNCNTNTNINCNNTNNTNNTNTTNNNYILNFGQSKDTIQPEQLVQILRNVHSMYQPGQEHLMSAEAINQYDKLLMEIPENNNFMIPDSKCLYAEVKIPGGWEKVPIDQTLNNCFKERATMLLNRKESIHTHNERVFQNKTNNQIFVETKQFSKRGFDHSYRGEDTRRIRTGFKINKLKNKKNVISF
jgi:hypothetical protein